MKYNNDSNDRPFLISDTPMIHANPSQNLTRRPPQVLDVTQILIIRALLHRNHKVPSLRFLSQAVLFVFVFVFVPSPSVRYRQAIRQIAVVSSTCFERDRAASCHLRALKW